jgi:threonine/homoserine/homoserine lactone efflux protein
VGIVQHPAQLIAFATFAAVVAGTPGPSNTLLTTVGARVGVRRGLPSLLGQVSGMSAMMFAVTLGLGKALLAHPLALQVLKWGGVAVLCWMAWRIATAAEPGHAANDRGGFVTMAAFQWINPKGWLVSVAAVTTFLNPHGGAPGQAATFAIWFALVALPSCFPWLAFGAALQRFLRTPRTRHALNAVLAALVAASAILFFWNR